MTKKAPKQTPDEAQRFEVYWNYKAGKFDTAAEYKASFREPRGYFRGAKIS
jgi:hypothetical protein